MSLEDEDSLEMIESLKSCSLEQLFKVYLSAEARSVFGGNTGGWRLKIKEASI
jgi:hypothetical protein